MVVRASAQPKHDCLYCSPLSERHETPCTAPSSLKALFTVNLARLSDPKNHVDSTVSGSNSNLLKRPSETLADYKTYL